jgi:hypothetical protein
MNLTKAIAELREECDRIDEAIQLFSRLATGASRGPRRPPKWLAGVKAKRRGRPAGTKLSAAARKAHSQRMKKYWAAKRKSKG